MRRFIDKYSALLATTIATIILAGYVDVRILLSDLSATAKINTTIYEDHVIEAKDVYKDFVKYKDRLHEAEMTIVGLEKHIDIILKER